MSLHDQVHNKRNCHADAANANESLDKLVAFFTLQKATEIASNPGATCHQHRNGPVDFAVDSKGDGTYHQEHVGEGILEGVNLDGRKSGVARESKNLHKSDTNLHDATVNGDGEKSKSAFESQLFGWSHRRFAQDILAQVAHDDHKADDDGKNRLKQLVADAH